MTKDEALKTYKNEEWLREQYIEREHSLADIAKDLSCSTTTVKHYMERFQIQRRDLSNAVRIATGNTLTPSDQLLQILYGEILSDGNLSINRKHKNVTSAI